MSYDAKHKPLPWHRDAETGEIFSGPADDYNRQTPVIGNLTDDVDDEDGEFIVRACNSHYDLLEACEAALAWMGPQMATEASVSVVAKLNCAVLKARTKETS